MKNIIELPGGTRISSGSDAERSIKSCTTTECVNGGAELTLGSACCSCLEAQIIVKGGKLGLAVGDLISLYKADEGAEAVKAGTFRLDKPAKKSDNVYKITAYDRIADLDKDLSAWLKSLTGWPYQLTAFAAMVCQACDLRYVPADILNEDFLVQEFHKAGVTGRQIMQWIGQIAGCFCRATADGNITFDWYTPSGVTIQPTGERYFFGGALTYEDYEVAPIDAVQLRLADGENGALWPAVTMGTVTYEYLRIRSGPDTSYAEVGRLQEGDQVRILEKKTVNGTAWGRIDQGWICLTGYVTLETVAADNPYVITGNAILLAKVTEDLIPYLNTLQTRLAGLPAYKPCKVSLPAGMDIRAGQTVQIEDKHGNTFTTLVMTKTQKGQRDTLECTGSARRDSSSAVNNKSAAQLGAEQEAYSQNAAKQAVDNQSWESLFNKWTNGGNIQGIFAQDGVWIFNAAVGKISNLIADMITAGKLKSTDGKTYFDLDNGKLVSASAGQRIEIVNGNIEVFDADGNLRIWITQGDHNYIYLCDNDGNICGGVGVGHGRFQIMAPDGNLDGTVAGHPVIWKTINGEKVLCAVTEVN